MRLAVTLGFETANGIPAGITMDGNLHATGPPATVSIVSGS